MEISVVSISAVVATLNQVTKLIAKDVFGKKVNRFIPIFSIVYGILLGVIGYYTKISDFGNTVIEAIFIGVSAGAAATGYHQVGKQLAKGDDEEDENYDDDEEDETEDDELAVEDVTLEDVTLEGESENEGDESTDSD